ncbi:MULTISPECIES: tripartite tricarboxylate transporter substrate binding protein [Sphaerochaeta]|jgi:tripartite-type tricarboxylate transporter receptor subunit TctC|uniref:Tripartite tricarboxylate transporter substrate binding protein n=2 Tax=root TaxID=1 RepID=A0ABY4DEC7_9SPIR|nr:MULTISPECIES: tripartite tricarboxylate transporter substrate binding protein [Sphaerochaeta]MDD3423396.1 tripartite tricarboxylate transporter substrate binding protein [Sphaerochaeta sp.]MDD3455336.1 tripartite tricarboxylate transporter substrate binding protein [Sphaerochaeta sp.]MDD4036809.1 tripartite tricarboxylate transporter substrate binding protein [Sphaerochaeta sp.]MDD4449898.1 tripartite tricarboxylate transporter substrate binding protein [Sphaerochaeta sp.]MDX9982705.1 tripa
MNRRITIALMLFCTFGLFAAGVAEQTSPVYPQKPITMIVPYGAGGTTDISGRQLAIQLEKHLGKSITVINQGGASGSIGARTVLDAKSDGYTVLFTAESLGTQRVMGLSEMSYDDFTPIMVAVNDPKVIVVHKDSPYQTLQDLVNDIKSRPGKVKMSYTGPGGSGHVQALIYNKMGLDMALTAYPGGADCIVAVLGRQVEFTNSNYSTVTGYLESGDLKLLGISALQRLEAHPEVPTLDEILPGSQKYLGNPFTPLSLLVKADVPATVVQILREAASKAVQEQAWKDFVAKNSLDKLYEKYPDEASMRSFFTEWESLVSWLLYDNGAAKISPEKFGIKKLHY